MVRRWLVWVLLAGLVAGVGTLVVRSADASAVVAEDVVVALDRTAVVINADPEAGAIVVTATVPGRRTLFQGIELITRHGAGASANVPNVTWDSGPGNTWQAVLSPTRAMDGAQVGVRVRSGMGHGYREVEQYSPRPLDIHSAVQINVTPPLVIAEGHRAPVVGTLTCWGNGDYHPFHTRFSMYYEESPQNEKWHLISGTTVSDRSGNFSVPLDSLPPLPKQKIMRIKVNVPGFGKPDEACGRTDAQANTYEFEVHQIPVVPPVAPQTLTITRGVRRANVTWTLAGPDGDVGITGFEVRLGEAVRPLPAGARSFTFTQLQPVTRYAIAVRMQNVLGWGPWVDATMVTTAPRAHAYASCTALRQDYPHGVGRPDSRGRGVRVTTYYPSSQVYALNDGRDKKRHQHDLDWDNDGIACEKG